jgi:hypothetical protein
VVSKKSRKAISPMPNTKSEFEVLPDGLHAHTVETPLGTIVYTYSPKIMSSILSGIFTTLLGRALYNKPLDFQRLIEIPEGEPPYLSLFIRDPDLLAEQEKHSEYAFELLQRQTPQLLTEASEQLIQEVIFRTLIEFKAQSQHQLNSKTSEVLKLLMDHIIERVKQRVNAPTAGGSNAVWTPERKEAFLVEYENACKTLKEAKRIYKQIKHSSKWKDMIAVGYPQLASHLIERLSGKDAQPGILAYEHAAALFNVHCNEYLPKVVKDARRRRREHETLKADN